MEIDLNGKKITTRGLTLLDLINETGFEQKALIAELNLKVIKQENWADTPLNQGDQIELLSFVGGG